MNIFNKRKAKIDALNNKIRVHQSTINRLNTILSLTGKPTTNCVYTMESDSQYISVVNIISSDTHVVKVLIKSFPIENNLEEARDKACELIHLLNS